MMEFWVISGAGVLGAIGLYVLVMWRARKDQDALRLRARRDLYEAHIERAEEILKQTTDHDARMDILKSIGNAKAELEYIDLEMQGWSVRRDA